MNITLPFKITMPVLSALLVLGAAHASHAAGISAVATTAMIGDLVSRIGGEGVTVRTLMGPGVDPHLYKPTAADAAALSKSDVIFYNGLMLEGRMADLFARISRGGKKVYAVTERVEETRLLEPPEFEGHYDPHVWMDVSLWSETIPVIVEGLSAAAPERAAEFQKNAEALKADLAALDAWCREQVASLPGTSRILVTSHDAYNYFGKAYGFQVVGLQGVSTASEAALADMASLVDFIKSTGVKAIFVESSVNPAAINRVAEDAGIKIGGELYSDAMGQPGEKKDGFETGTYEGMIRYNMTTIVNALK